MTPDTTQAKIDRLRAYEATRQQDPDAWDVLDGEGVGMMAIIEELVKRLDIAKALAIEANDQHDQWQLVDKQEQTLKTLLAATDLNQPLDPQ